METHTDDERRAARKIIIEIAMPIIGSLAAMRLLAVEEIEKEICQIDNGTLSMLEAEDRLGAARASLDRIQLAMELLRSGDGSR